jgi:hypothetical protein
MRHPNVRHRGIVETQIPDATDACHVDQPIVSHFSADEIEHFHMQCVGGFRLLHH